MISSQQILELPVLSIEEGKKIGKVKHLVLNPQRGTVDFLLVEDGKWYLGLKALPFGAVQGIGEHALTVSDRSSLSNVAECAGAVDLLEKDLRLAGIKVLSAKGRLVGSISEYFIDDNTGDIAGCQLIPANSQKPAGIIPRKFILTYGSDYLVVEEGIEEKLVDELQKESAYAQERQTKAEAVPASAVSQVATGDKQPEESIKHFKEQQRQYLLGKKAAIKIIADNGEVVVEEGETITDEIIERAKAADKYIQLTLNVRD